MASVALVTPYFWPDVAASVPLVTTLADDLAKAGHEVTVLTMRPSRIEFLAGGQVAEVVPMTAQERIRVIRLRNPAGGRRGLLWKLLEYAWFSLWAAIRLSGLRRVHVCFVSSNPPLLPLLLGPVCRLRRAHLLYNLQDLFPGSAVAAGLIPPFLEQALRPFERWTYLVSDLVVTISDGFQDHVRKVAPSARVRTVPNWVDTDFLHPVLHTENRFRALVQLNGKFVVLYAGNMGFLQDLPPVIAAAAMLRDVEDIKFVFVGGGPDRPRLEAAATAQKLSNCSFFDFQPHELVSQVYSAGDVGLVSTRQGSGRTSIPSKTWAIMACGRPVVAACDEDSELASIIRETGAGLLVQPGDARALAYAVLSLYKDRPLRESMGQAGRAYVEANLSRKVITLRYEAMIRELVATDRMSRAAHTRSGVSPLRQRARAPRSVWRCCQQVEAWVGDGRSRVPEVEDQGNTARIRAACMGDLADIVAVHVRAFPGFLMTRLGHRFLGAYYTLVLRSPTGIALVAEARTRVVGFVVGYADPKAFYRVLRASKARLAMSMIPGLVRDPGLVRWVFASFRRADPKATDEHAGFSELASVAVDPVYSAQGIGSRLTCSFVEEARRSGARGVYLTTDAEANESVNRFYGKLGFTPARTFQTAADRKMNEYRLVFERSPAE